MKLQLQLHRVTLKGSQRTHKINITGFWKNGYFRSERASLLFKVTRNNWISQIFKEIIPVVKDGRTTNMYRKRIQIDDKITKLMLFQCSNDITSIGICPPIETAVDLYSQFKIVFPTIDYF